MNILHSVGILLTFCALFAYINQRSLRLPPVLAMTIMSIVFALGILVAGKVGILPLAEIRTFVRSFNFADLVLHGILPLLLFAGSLFVNFDQTFRWAKPILALATVGVFLSALVVGTLLWLTIPFLTFFHVELSFWWCLLFGAVIAPTDPIAALAIVKKAGAPKEMETKMVGESLTNDATGVMMFLIVLGIVQTGEVSTRLLIQELFFAPLGGVVLGVVGGWIATKAIRTVDHHPTEILMTLALATGVYSLAEVVHASAPIAVVVAGLVIGYKARGQAMSEKTREHMDAFWEGMDEVINALLFALIGLELLVIADDVSWSIIAVGVLAWVIVLVGRWAGVFGSLLPLHRSGGLGKGTTRVMVWGGLRGGISLALALSLPQGPEANVLVVLTFIVVILSSVVQGLTLNRIIPRQVEADATDPDALHEEDPVPPAAPPV